MKKVFLANPRGLCAGVDRAILILNTILAKYHPPIYVKHELVHNKYVIEEFQKKGVVFIEDIDDLESGSILVYSAHGISQDFRKLAESKNLEIFDATCPLVTKVHLELKKLYQEQNIIVMIGHKNHPEVLGTMGQVKDKIFLIETIDDVQPLALHLRDIYHDELNKIALITQTTLSVDDTKNIINKLQSVFPHIQLPKKSDICYATQNRQDAVKQLTKYCELILVIGSYNSSNANRLCEVSLQNGVPSYLINSEVEIIEESLVNITNLGITAGASTPEYLVEKTLNHLKSYGFYEKENLVFTKEDIVFAIPSKLKQ